MIETKKLANGVTVLSEKLDFVRSASVGIWVGNGSRYETEKENGVSHFIEHMLFKGTDTRTAAQIAEQMDAIGGQFNAFTTKEFTSFYFRSLDTMLDRGIDVLTDMLISSAFPVSELDTERGVIDEEIDMYEDTPDDLVTDNLFSAVYPDSPLGRPIVGTHESIAQMDSDFLRDYMHAHYTGPRIAASISGNFTPETLAHLCAALEAIPGTQAPDFVPAAYTSGEIIRKKPIEQVHICLGFPAFAINDERRYALSVFSNILGGGMSSRLFQKIREENGLCYSIYTFSAAHYDTGVSGIYLATNAASWEKAIDMVLAETKRLQKDGPTQEEFERAREQINSNILMSLESTLSRMNAMARSQLMYGRILTADDSVAAYNAVDPEACIEAGRAAFDAEKLAKSIVGNI
ncbi:MAG: insulinase family protein [Oscillospiraceae bacterium]|nr:insulinase family protein [Oscillospiraceae bacterium]